MPPLLLLILLIAVFGSLSSGITYLFKKLRNARKWHIGSDMSGELFGLIGGIYGLLLGFVVFLVYDALNDAQEKASQEQSLARTLYREIRYYPDTTSTAPLMHAYLAFVHTVVEKEFPQMERMEKYDLRNRVYLDNVYRETEKLNIADPNTADMMEHLNELATYRNLRQLASQSDITFEVWLALILGYLILLVSSLFLHVTSIRMHSFANGLLGAFIGLVVYIIVMVNHPFTGKMKIEPELYNTILEMAREDHL